MLPISAFIIAWCARPLRVFCSVVLAVLVLGCATPLPLPEAADIPYGQGRLWQAERPGQPPSYLFGTMHVNDPRVLDLPEAVESAFAKAEAAIFEVDYRRRSARKDLNQYFYLPEGQSLRDVLGYNTYRDLLRVNPGYWNRYRYSRSQPWVAWMAIGGREVPVEGQIDAERPILDDWLSLRARKARKELGFLETDKEQWRTFGGIPMEDQVSMLRSAIDTYYGARTRVDRVEIYLRGDLALLYALRKRSLADLDPAVAERYLQRLLVDRNHRMVERALPVMERSSTFIAVGALHMPGEEGMLRLLEQSGYRISKLY